MNELKGTIKTINILENEKYPKAQLILVTDDEKYPQTICVEFSEKLISVVRNYENGDDVTISYNIQGREWVNNELQTKYFTTIKGWKIVKN